MRKGRRMLYKYVNLVIPPIPKSSRLLLFVDDIAGFSTS